jgi:hypothetical protein
MREDHAHRNEHAADKKKRCQQEQDACPAIVPLRANARADTSNFTDRMS